MKHMFALALVAALISPMGDFTSNRTVNAVEPAPPELVSISVGNDSACALVQGGSVACWGANWAGGLGTGTRYSSVIPQIATVGGTATQIAVGATHACALLEDGTLRCWGDNYTGQVGDVALGEAVLVPTVVPGVDHVVSLSAGAAHTCAVRDDGTAWCWGNGSSGQLGAPDLWDDIPPTQVPGITTAVSVAAGDWHTCLLLGDHTVSCFGYLPDAAAGYLNTVYAPTAIAGFEDIVSLVAGGDFTCGIRSTGRVRCYGANWSGQLGDGTNDFRGAPVRAGSIEDAVALGAGLGHACAATAAGELYCWGWTYGGALGSPPPEDTFWLPPQLVPGLSGVTAVDGGMGFTCAVTSGVGSCWGVNDRGQLGDRTIVSRSNPQPISWVPDPSAPGAGSPTASIRTNQALDGWKKQFLVRLTSEVDDGLDGTGVDHVEVRFSRDGGATWGPVRWKRPSWNRWMRPIGTLLLQVRAVDRVGNVGEWVTSTLFTPQLVEETSESITAVGAWLPATKNAYSGGSAASSTTAEDSATFTFTGWSFGIVSHKGKLQGSFRVFVDGQDAGAVDLHNRWPWFRVVVFARSWTTYGEHTVQIVNLAEPTHPRIDLDAIVVLG